MTKDFEEICPYCDAVNEYSSENGLSWVKCNECGKWIKTCDLCDPKESNCNLCPLDTIFEERKEDTETKNWMEDKKVRETVIKTYKKEV